MASTTYQKEMVKTLRKRQFVPMGLRGNSHLVMHHPLGFTVDIPGTPSDNKTTKNLMAKVEQGIKFMSQAGPQFEQWMFQKWELEPGETKLIECKMPEQIRLFFNDSGIHGASRNAISRWIARRDNWTNTQPDKHGKGPRIWEVTRPAAIEIIEEVDPTEFEDEVEPTPSVPLDRDDVPGPAEGTPEPLEALETLVQEELPPNGNIVSPEVIERLTAALAGPLQTELADRTERLQLAHAELEAVSHVLGIQIEELTKARDVILNLMSVLEG